MTKGHISSHNSSLILPGQCNTVFQTSETSSSEGPSRLRFQNQW